VWLTTTRTRVSDATAVTFSVKCFNPLKLYPLSGNMFRMWFASYFLFIHSSGKSYCCNDTFIDSPVYIAGSKEYFKRIQIIFKLFN